MRLVQTRTPLPLFINRAAAFSCANASPQQMSLPDLRIVEPHHHYVNTTMNFGSFLKQLGVPDYTPEQFKTDVAGIDIAKTVHIEAMPSDPLGEALFVESVIQSEQSPVAGIVAACNLASDDAKAQLSLLKSCVPHLVGIRYIVDYTGPFGNDHPATHIAVARHTALGVDVHDVGSGVDFLRDPLLAPKFEAGFAQLAQHNLTFDLQCAPEQLHAAAVLFARHPQVPVVIDHLGKPRLSGEPTLTAADEAELAVWRSGMAAMAALRHVSVKLSMLGFIVPGWVADNNKESLVASLVLETIERFGPARCMFSTNWWSNGAMANSDGRDEVDISIASMWQRYLSWVTGKFSEEDIRRLFGGTADAFYFSGR